MMQIEENKSCFLNQATESTKKKKVAFFTFGYLPEHKKCHVKTNIIL